MAAIERFPAHPANPAVSLVVCTLDESESIVGVLREASSVLEGFSHEIIVVDDSSDDRTAQAVLGFAADHPTVSLLRREGARGLASAVIAGWDCARGRKLAVCDGDGQHDLQLLPRMLNLMEERDADLVAASRYIENETGLNAMRTAMSRVATRATTGLLAGNLTDPLSGFFVLTKPTFEAARPTLSGIGFKILVDVVGSSPRPLTMFELPASLRAREHGESKLDIRVVADLGAMLVEKGTRGLIPARLALFGAVGVSGVAVHMSVLEGLLQVFPLGAAQVGAILCAMSWNFWINNILTFRDMRLQGLAMWRGLLSFYVACLSGGILSWGVSMLLAREGLHPLAAGGVGALTAGLWNYYACRRATWGMAKGDAPASPAAASTPIRSHILADE